MRLLKKSPQQSTIDVLLMILLRRQNTIRLLMCLWATGRAIVWRIAISAIGTVGGTFAITTIACLWAARWTIIATVTISAIRTITRTFTRNGRIKPMSQIRTTRCMHSDEEGRDNSEQNSEETNKVLHNFLSPLVYLSNSKLKFKNPPLTFVILGTDRTSKHKSILVLWAQSGRWVIYVYHPNPY